MIRKSVSSPIALAVGAAFLTLSGAAYAQDTIELELWSRADNSGPLRPGNILTAADRLNEQLEAEGADFRVSVTVLEQPDDGSGFDGDAEKLLRAFAIGEGPDMFIAAHEWICAFANSGFAYDLTDYTNDNPDLFGDVFPSLWTSTECGGRRFAVPQDAEARMFFFNKGLMRDAGFDDDFIESLDQRVLDGEVTLDQLSDIAAQVVNESDAEYGILHRPSRGPDYLMVFQQYGNSFLDADSGKLLLEEDKLAGGFGWFARNVELGVTPGNNTSLEWDFIRDQFYTENNAFMWMYGIWDLGSNAFPRGVPSEEDAFFAQFGWTAAPAAETGGQAGSLTHPIVYAVAAESENAELAARVVGFATAPDLNTLHAVSTTHLGVNRSQLEDPAYIEQWPLALATPLLEITSFMPNHPDFGALNSIIYEALQGVELGRLSADEAAQFVIEEADSRIPDSVMIQ